MKRELTIFLTALMYYTRIPCGKWVNMNGSFLNEATKYFPLIGWIVGLCTAVVFIGGNFLFGTPIGILLSMSCSVLLTGAFHEDGFADFCDGFGGGWTKEKILEIMKDSRVGTYGVVGLLLLFSIKFLALQELVTFMSTDLYMLILLFITAHALSRFTAASFIFTHPYVRLSEDSKVKPVAQATKKSNLIIAAVFAIIPLFALILLTQKLLLLLICAPLYLLTKYLGWYFTKWIDGYTGDCLGATQQLGEIFIYLSCLIVWKFF